MVPSFFAHVQGRFRRGVMSLEPHHTSRTIVDQHFVIRVSHGELQMTETRSTTTTTTTTTLLIEKLCYLLQHIHAVVLGNQSLVYFNPNQLQGHCKYDPPKSLSYYSFGRPHDEATLPVDTCEEHTKKCPIPSVPDIVGDALGE